MQGQHEREGVVLRDHPEGPISSDVITTLTRSVHFVPIAFIGVVALAIAGDVWLYRTRTGLALRAVGLDETSSRRIGMTAIGRSDPVALFEDARDTGRDRLLPRIEMRRAVHLAGKEQRLDEILDAADEQHGATSAS